MKIKEDVANALFFGTFSEEPKVYYDLVNNDVKAYIQGFFSSMTSENQNLENKILYKKISGNYQKDEIDDKQYYLMPKVSIHTFFETFLKISGQNDVFNLYVNDFLKRNTNEKYLTGEMFKKFYEYLDSLSSTSNAKNLINLLINHTIEEIVKDWIEEITYFRIEKFQTMEYVLVGSQKWSVQNLNVSKFRNGDVIPEVKSTEQWERMSDLKMPAYCYYDNNNSLSVKQKKLYNWYAVMDARGLAPLGWHIPTNDEWGLLVDTLGGWELAGQKLKKLFFQNDTNHDLSYFFNGARDLSGNFIFLNEYEYWWTSTPHVKNSSLYRCISIYDNSIKRNFNMNIAGLSVRCVMD